MIKLRQLIMLVLLMAPFTIGADYQNCTGMKMIQIPAGEFMMGSENGDWDEKPVHKVKITTPFYISETEVTNQQYEQFDPEHNKLRGKHGYSTKDDEAVIFVSYEDAAKFCLWLSQKEAKPYRLPTEAEWEYACRAGTTTEYYTGADLPEKYHKNQKTEWGYVTVDLTVKAASPNKWGIYDMHGNVEEWCDDWFGPYTDQSQNNPAGPVSGTSKICRGGSHSTEVFYLRSANRASMVIQDRNHLIGFRVVQAPHQLKPQMQIPDRTAWKSQISQTKYNWPNGPSPEKPYFHGPRQYVKIPDNSDGPLYSQHNHQPAITFCANGDLLAIWYCTRKETGRELTVVASRLPHDSDQWDPACIFWNLADRNDHGSDIWFDGDKTIYHFNGFSTDGTWGKMALLMRQSTDNGLTWSSPQIINPEHALHHQPIAGMFRTQEGYLVLKCDAVTGGKGGTALHISKDKGKTWVDPGQDREQPTFENGNTGAWIAGIHAGVTQLKNGDLMALGRKDNIEDQMPKSTSSDMGQNWTYSPSGIIPIAGGQRLVLMRLNEGPLFLASFADELTLTDAAGNLRKVSGLYAALSYDEGKTWPTKRLITDDKPPRQIDGGAHTKIFTLGPNTAEPKGYMAGTQTPDGIIQLISSKQHYAFNLKWLETSMPASK